jgi:LysM repeat protein
MPEVLRPAPTTPALSSSVATYNLGETSESGETGMPENMMVYVAKRGDTLSSIAKKFHATVADIKDFNELRRHRVRAGQKLFVPKPSEGEEEKVASSAPVKPSVVAKKEVAAPAPLAVSAPVSNGLPSAVPALESFKIEASAGTGVVRVKSEESLGLYASWAVTNVQEILRLNKWKKNHRLALGMPVTVPLTGVSKEKFEESRLKYHKKMLDGFFASFSISGVDNRVLRRGQTIWNISEGNGDTPMWLLAMYNQDKKLDKLHPGETIRIPVVRKKLS